MVIDTSALIAILEQEHDAPRVAAAIASDGPRLISTASLVEAGIVVLARRGEAGAADLDELVAEAQLDVVPVTLAHARLAREGFRRFGKGRHPAALNFGDCFTYALAKATSQPILCTGGDFAASDMNVAT